MTKTLYVTVGLPGSGKSMTIKARSLHLGGVIVSPDSIAYDADGHFDQAKLSDAWKQSYAKLLSACSDGAETIVFDATLVKPDYRGAIIAIGRHFGYHVVALDKSRVPTHVAIIRNRDRIGKDAVPEAVILRMALEMVPPNHYDANEFDEVRK